jgi:hypothetical protein
MVYVNMNELFYEEARCYFFSGFLKKLFFLDLDQLMVQVVYINDPCNLIEDYHVDNPDRSHVTIV